MTLLKPSDFETEAGQEKIIRAIHSLDHKVHELTESLHELARKEDVLERDREKYD